MAEPITEQIKCRERWWPFCPSMLDCVAPQMFQTEHPVQYMTFAFDFAEALKADIPEVTYEDGTARAQFVSHDVSARYYAAIEDLACKSHRYPG